MPASNNSYQPAPQQPNLTPPPLPAYLREHQVLQSLPISRATIWRLVAADKLKVVRISKRVTLLSAQSVLDYLAECEAKGRR